MMYQVWFSVNKEPEIPQAYLESKGYLAPNWFYPIGNSVNGRMLCRCMTEDFEIIRAELDKFNKQTLVVGARYQNGDWLEQYPQDIVEFTKYMQDTSETIAGEIVISKASDNTSAGWFGFNDILTMEEI